MGLKHNTTILFCVHLIKQPFVTRSSPSLSHLDLFKVEGHFAVFTVERSLLTFSLVVSVLVRTKDGHFAGLALHPFQFTAAFMLSLKMEDGYNYCIRTANRCPGNGCFIEEKKQLV